MTSIRLHHVPLNSPKTTVRKDREGLWRVVLWGIDATDARFGSWDRAMEYATTGRIVW